MTAALPVLLVLLLCGPARAQDSGPKIQRILSRVAEEAELFQQKAPKALAQETLEQRTAAAPGGRTRPGGIRKIVSEYTIGPMKDTGVLVEFRQVISVDGRTRQSPEKARHALSLGVLTPDDRARRRMLEDFARNGLTDVATDYAPILLAFTNRGLQTLEISPSGQDRVGADDALVFLWKQRSPEGGALVFAGSDAGRSPLEGKLYAREPDGLPLRIQVWSERRLSSGHTIREEATIDYAMSSHGFVAPVSVRHQHLVDGRLRTENLYTYGPFRLFSADTQIRFNLNQ